MTHPNKANYRVIAALLALACLAACGGNAADDDDKDTTNPPPCGSTPVPGGQYPTCIR